MSSIYDQADALRKDNGFPTGEAPLAVMARVLVDANNNPVSFGNNTPEIVTATNVILATEKGRTYFLNSATEFGSTLPPVASGLRFTFICTAAPSGASYTIVTDSSANVIKGSIVTSATGAADTETSGADTISFVDGVAVAGDKVELYCDGTNWFCYGQCVAAGGITMTTAS